MKFKYRKIAFVFCAIVTGTLSFLAVFLYGYFIGAEKERYIKAFFICCTFFAFCVFMFSGEYSNRYVELSNDYIRFNSFRFKKIRNTVSLSIKYEDIFSIKAKTIPLIGLWGVKINARNIPHEILLTICFCNHTKMITNICKIVKQKKPDIYIDSFLQKYLEKKHEK